MSDQPSAVDKGVNTAAYIPPNDDARALDITISPASGIAVATGLAPTVSMTATATMTAEGTVTRFAFPPEWEQDRQEALRILRTLPGVLREAEEAFRLLDEVRRLGIGGNHPPESIADLPPSEEIITEATVAGDALLTELTADTPHLSSVRIAARALRRVAQWTGAILRWMAEKGDRFLDEYLKQLAKPTAIVTAGWIGAKLLGVETLLHSITGHTGALFALLHIPF